MELRDGLEHDGLEIFKEVDESFIFTKIWGLQ